jgi:putative phosphoribosyl transferase
LEEGMANRAAAVARRERTRNITIGPVGLEGMLVVPDDSTGTVLFAHGSGSGRFSPRNIFVARALREARFATLLFDLLTGEEAQNRANVFDIQLLAERLSIATAWAKQDADTAALPVAYFGASTGAAATLVAAASGRWSIGAIVSRGGRPDLAGDALGKVTAPTLLIVGGADTVVLDLNRAALAELHCEKHLAVVPGATHLFEEPGTLEAVVDLARSWFESHLPERTP